MLVGTDVCVWMVVVWEETRVPGGNPPVWLGDHMTISHVDAGNRNPVCSGERRVGYHCASQTATGILWNQTFCVGPLDSCGHHWSVWTSLLSVGIIDQCGHHWSEEPRFKCQHTYIIVILTVYILECIESLANVEIVCQPNIYAFTVSWMCMC